jgi:hypothetical protein
VRVFVRTLLLKQLHLRKLVPKFDVKNHSIGFNYSQLFKKDLSCRFTKQELHVWAVDEAYPSTVQYARAAEFGERLSLRYDSSNGPQEGLYLIRV